MRWIMIAMTLIGFVVAFLTKSPGLLGFALLIGFIGLFGTVFSLAAERVSASARPDTTMLQPEVIAAIRARAKAQAATHAAENTQSPSRTNERPH
jgi:disulfide bond formation protein DsbB